MASLNKFIKPTLLSAGIFYLCTIISYHLTIDRFKVFELGYPFQFYQQSIECGADWHDFNWTIKNVFYDYTFTWLLAIICTDTMIQKQEKSHLSPIQKMIRWTPFIIWCILSIIIGLFLISKLQNPFDTRSRSVALLGFGYFAIWTIGIFRVIKMKFKLFKT